MKLCFALSVKPWVWIWFLYDLSWNQGWMGQDWDYGSQPTVQLSLVTSLHLRVTATANHMRCVIFAYNTFSHMTRPNINPLNVSPDPAPEAQASRIMSTLCLHHDTMTSKRFPSCWSFVRKPPDDRWFPNIGPIMLSFCMMTSSNGNIFCVTGPLCGGFIGHRWIPRTKASDSELWYFLWSSPE